MRDLNFVLIFIISAFMSACGTMRIIHPIHREFREFEEKVGMTSDEASESVWETFNTRSTVDELVVDGEFFFSVDKEKLRDVNLTGYYVNPRTKRVTYKESTKYVKRLTPPTKSFMWDNPSERRK